MLTNYYSVGSQRNTSWITNSLGGDRYLWRFSSVSPSHQKKVHERRNHRRWWFLDWQWFYDPYSGLSMERKPETFPREERNNTKRDAPPLLNHWMASWSLPVSLVIDIDGPTAGDAVTCSPLSRSLPHPVFCPWELRPPRILKCGIYDLLRKSFPMLPTKNNEREEMVDLLEFQ